MALYPGKVEYRRSPYPTWILTRPKRNENSLIDGWEHDVCALRSGS